MIPSTASPLEVGTTILVLLCLVPGAIETHAAYCDWRAERREPDNDERRRIGARFLRSEGRKIGFLLVLLLALAVALISPPLPPGGHRNLLLARNIAFLAFTLYTIVTIWFDRSERLDARKKERERRERRLKGVR